MENAYVLTDKKALHLRALKTFTDDFGKERMNGEEWLVTLADTETHILNVYEQLVAVVDVITLNSRQYCVILDPVADGKPQLGKKVSGFHKKRMYSRRNELFSRNSLWVKNPFSFNPVKNWKMGFKMFTSWEKMKV